MTSHFRKPISAPLFGLALSFTAIVTPAFAFEPSGNDIADAFLTLLEAEEGTVESYGNVTQNGDTVTIEAIKLTEESGKSVVVTLAETALSDAEQLTNGRMRVGKFTINGLNLRADDGELAIASFDASDLVLPSPEEAASSADAGAIAPSYSELEIHGTTVSDEEGNQATVARIFVAIDEMEGDLPTASRFNIEGLVVDTATLDDEGRKALSDLGYDKLTLNAEGSGKWDPETAIVTVSDLSITGLEAGKFTVAFQLGGVTREVVAELNKSQDNPENALALLQGISVEMINIRLDNDSLVERVLDMQAKEAGTDRAGIVAQLEAGLPFMLGILQNPQFQAEVASSLTSFLREPGSLTVKASPASPVPVTQIMGTVMMAPQNLPQVLGIAVSAND
ncbi:hypothetical protein [Roseibium sp.]|uniref:hypothetical protein n=1 Tax=Roseibium sp. TaxID=1936156 RepID=UPI003A96C56E